MMEINPFINLPFLVHIVRKCVCFNVRYIKLPPVEVKCPCTNTCNMFYNQDSLTVVLVAHPVSHLHTSMLPGL